MNRNSGRSARDCGRASFARTAWLLLCVLVFGFQQFVAQSHVHPFLAAPKQLLHVGSSSVSVGTQDSHHGDKDDTDGCASCQLAMAIGTALASAPPLLSALYDGVDRIALLQAGTSVTASISQYDWQSRAPPQAL